MEKQNLEGERALLAAEEAKPSKEPAYWAKRSCKRCFGRGIEGVITVKFGDGNTMKNEQLCYCASKNFAKWRNEFIKKWLINNPEIISEENTGNI